MDCDRSQNPFPFASTYREHCPGYGSFTRPKGQVSASWMIVGIGVGKVIMGTSMVVGTGSVTVVRVELLPAGRLQQLQSQLQFWQSAHSVVHEAFIVVQEHVQGTELVVQLMHEQSF